MRAPSGTLLSFVLSLVFSASVALAQTPVVSVSPASLSFPTTTATVGQTNASVPGSVTLNNTGSVPLSISLVSVSGDFSVGPNYCGTTLAAGSSCQIYVYFLPTAAGLRTGTLSISDDAADSPQTVALSGAGTWLSENTSSLFFALQLANTSSTQSMTLTNTGALAIPLGPFAITGDFTQANNCGTSIAAGTACNISITFTPAGDGNRTGSLTILDNSLPGGGTISILLNGMATWLTASPSSLTFQYQSVGTSSPPMPVVIQNTATTPISLSLALDTKPPFGNNDFTKTDNCGTTLAAGASCTASVVYSPTGSTPPAPGGSYNTLLISSDGVTLGVPCAGAGTWFNVTPSQLTFPMQVIGTTSGSQSVTLTNVSNNSQNLAPFFSPGSSFSQTNSCGSSVAPGASCVLNIVFTPTAVGTQSDTLSTAGLPIVSVSGSGMWQSVTPSSLSFPLQLVGTTSAAQSITLTNVSSTSQSVSVNLFGNGVGFTVPFAQTNNCGSSLAAGSSCTVNVTFTPVAAGAASGTVSFGLFGGSSVHLSGTGTFLGLTPSSLSFGSQDVGTASPAQVITVTNTSGGAVTFNGIAATGDYAQSNTCPATGAALAPGASCAISVTFNPTVTGTSVGMVTLTDSDLGSPQTIALSGFGAGLSVAPSSLSFPMQLLATTSAPQAVTLTNIGNASRSFSISLSGAGFAQANNCGSSLAAGASCTINITFTPAALGSQSGTLNMGSSAPTVSLNGIGIWQKITPASLSFPTQLVGTTSGSQTITLTNVSNAAQNFGVSVSGASFAETNNCSSPLAAGSSCTANVTFAPTAAGVQGGSIFFVSSFLIAPQASLAGAGTLVGVTPGSLSFGAQAVGSVSPAQTITVTNTASTGLTLSGIAITGDFAQTSNCPLNGTVLAANASCTINVTFSPIAGGARTGSVTINDSDPGSPQTVALGGSGLAPVAQFSPATLTFPGELVGNSSASQSITVTNTGAGGSVLQISSVTVTGDFSQTNNCTVSMGAGSSCAINVIFTPSATGTRTGSLSVSDNSAGSPHSVPLTGTGMSSVSPRTIVLTPGQVQQFTTPLTNPSWAVNGILGGSASVGTITTSGLYTAPAVVGAYDVTATFGSQGSAKVYVSNLAGVYTYHNDNASTGQNLNEIALVPGNVNSTQFGKLFSLAVDGQVYAQPLYVQGVNIPGKGTHNVLFIATEHDSVYAFDAANNTGTNANPLWKKSLIPTGGRTVTTGSTGDLTCTNITPEIGITGTPVIDSQSGTLYVVSKTKEGTRFVQRLHALDITTGAEKFGGPIVIQASVKGTGDGSSGGVVNFNPQTANNRAGLLLQNGLVYVGWASHCDHGPYHGWVIAYNAQTLARTGVFNTSPNTGLTGIWMGGSGLAGDGANLFFATGNGTFDVSTGGKSYGDSILRLTPPSGGALPVGSYFTPFDQSSLNGGDVDVGSGGTLLLPTQTGAHPHLLVQVGKEGTIYLIDRDTMGGYCAGCSRDTQIVQELTRAISGVWGMPAFWNNNIYFGGSGDYLKAFSFDAQGSGLLSGPTSSTTAKFGGYGPTPSVSANAAGNGVAWAIQNNSGTAVLRALDATNLSVELYNSTQSANLGKAVKFTVPTVANGRVYVGTQNQIDVYGLLP